MRWQRIPYRFRQFFQVLWANVRRVDNGYAQARLDSQTLLALFQSMSRQEQNHAIDVCQALETAGQTNKDLLTAALLHDVGKCRLRITIIERVWVVLGEYAFPEASQRWAEEKNAHHLLRRGFVLRQHHAAWGADMARVAGASAQTVDIIRRHNEKDSDSDLIRTLYAADDR